MSMTREEAIAYFEARGNYNPHDGTNREAEKLALAALRGPTREMVERVWFREPYTRLETWDREDGATVYSARNSCMSCGQETPIGNFCCNCGAALTDEAVDMVLERWKEALSHVGD